MTDLQNCTVTAEPEYQTTMEALLRTVLNNYRLSVLGYAAFVHEYKTFRRDMLEGRAEKGIYLSSGNGVHSVYLYKLGRVTTTEHASFNDCQFPLLRKPIESLGVVEQYEGAAEEEGTLKRNISIFVDTFEKEASETRDEECHVKNTAEAEHYEEASG